MFNKKIVVDVKSLLLVSIFKIIIIGTCISGTIVLICTNTNWLEFPTAYILTNMGIIGQLFMVLPMLISQLSEIRTVFLVVVCNSFGIASNIFAVASIYNIEFLMKTVIQNHHIAIAILSTIDLGLLTPTINEGIFDKPIKFVEKENLK